jgi:TPR repeat protein
MYAGEKNQIQPNSLTDYTKSIQYLSKSAKQGHGDAMNMLGIMYEDGKGVKQSDKRALQYYYRAMELGSKDGATNYANFVAQHPRAAQEIYQETANEYLKNSKHYQNLMDIIKR